MFLSCFTIMYPSWHLGHLNISFKRIGSLVMKSQTWVVRTLPKVEAIVLVELISQGKTAKRTLQLEHIHYSIQIELWGMRQIAVLNQLNQELRRPWLRSDDVNPVFGSSESHVEDTPFLGKRNCPIFILDELNDRVILDSARKSKLSVYHIQDDYIIITEAFRTVSCHECDLCFGILLTHNPAVKEIELPGCSKIVQVEVVPSDQ